MARNGTILLIGAGQASASALSTLRMLGHAGPVTVVGEELHPPYERPPLSKGVLLDSCAEAALPILPPDIWQTPGVQLLRGMRVQHLDTAARQALLEDGRVLDYHSCLLATGGRARTLPHLPVLPCVYHLRTLEDARALRVALQAAQHVLVLGAGFLGLEVASTVRKLGKQVSVVESAPQVLARALPPELGLALQTLMREHGVDLHLGQAVLNLQPCASGVQATLANGQMLQADVVLMAIGQSPEVSLARQSGLAIDGINGGIFVDALCRTSAAHVYAAGDCASQHIALAGMSVRLESWQNANEQGRMAAASMLGQDTTDRALPWFWTDLFGLNIQMQGLPAADLHYHLRGEPGPLHAATKALYFGLRDQRLVYAVAINAGGELRALRALMQSPFVCDAARLSDPQIPMRQLVRELQAAQVNTC